MAGETVGPSFCCLKCGNPLKLDASLIAATTPGRVDSNLLQEITAPLYNTGSNIPTSGLQPNDITVENIEYTNNHVKKSLLSSTTSSHTAVGSEMDFLLVGEVGAEQHLASGGIEQLIRVRTRLFDFLSEQAEIDHPLCEDCAETTLDMLGEELKAAEDECTSYKQYLDELEVSSTPSDSEEDYELTLKQLKEEEQLLLKKISDIDGECKNLDSELLIEDGKQRDLKVEEQELLREYNELKRQVFELETDYESAENQFKYAEVQLDRLVKLNPFNSTFHIWYSGHFGTINGLRLGRLPNVPVEWNEINTAWGQTVLLLDSLARKLNLVFLRYRLVPYGSHSYIECLSDRNKELPLYCAGGYRFFWDKKFDQAMVAFLDCLSQFIGLILKSDGHLKFPYEMKDGVLKDANSCSSYSIKMQFNSEEQWTKALKFMLTNLRWGVIWVSSKFANND